ncbi:hypothetical protein LINPERPRIM_LOCUS20377 [Linum perenne]
MEDVHFITGLTVDGPAVTSATPFLLMRRRFVSMLRSFM